MWNGKINQVKREIQLLNANLGQLLKKNTSLVEQLPGKKRIDTDMVDCKLCKKRLTTKELQSHVCLGEQMTCKYCSKQFDSTLRFLMHLGDAYHVAKREQDRKTKNIFRCDKCQLAYPLLILLECHKLSHSEQQCDTIFEPVPNEEPVDVFETENLLKCKIIRIYE